MIRALIWIGIVACLVPIAIAVLQRYRESESGGRLRCPSNLRQIGQGLQLYCDEFHGATPPTLAALGKAEDINQTTFVCPDCGKPYVYLRPTTRFSSLSADDTVAFCPLGSHGGDGVNVLFGDGHVECIQAGGQHYTSLLHPTTQPAP